MSGDSAPSTAVGYFETRVVMDPKAIRTVRAWCALLAVPVLDGDELELASALAGQIAAFRIIDKLDVEGVEAPGAGDPRWR